MVKKSKGKGFDPLEFSVRHGRLTVGTMGVLGLADRMPDSPSKQGVVRGMAPLKVVPTVHAVGGSFGALRRLEGVVKKKRRR